MCANVRALIVKTDVVDPEESAFFIEGCANLVSLLAGMVGRHQMFTAVLDPFHRAPQPHGGGENQNFFRIDLAADAKAAADMAFEAMHGRGAAAEHARNGFPIAMRHFGSAVQFED